MSAVPAYLLFALLALVGPGIALQRLARVRPEIALVLPLGWLLTAALYGLALALGLPLLFPIAILALDASLLFTVQKPWPEPPTRSSVGAAGLFVLVLAFTQYPLNRRVTGGDFALDPVLTEDTAFHAALAWELSSSFPPQVPGFSGRPLAYHVGFPLVRGAACRFAGVAPYDSLTRFDNTLGALSLVLVFPAVVSALGGSAGAIALAPFLLFASDLSFLLARGRPMPFWIETTKGSDILLSILQSNATVPALALALGVVVALRRHEEGAGKGWLVLAALLGAGVAFFKVFVAAQLLLGLGLAVVLARNRASFFFVTAATGLATLAFVLVGGGREGVFFEPLTILRAVRQNLGLAPPTEAPPLLFLLVWLVFSLGLRLAGLPAALRALGSRSGPGLLVAGIALSGWPLALLFRISPLEIPDRPQNEALYFLEQSGVVFWVFVSLSLGALRLSGAWRGLLGALALALALPSTVQFVLAKHALPTLRVPSEILAAMEALGRSTKEGDVVLERPGLQRFPPPPLVFIGRRVPLTTYFPFLTQWVPKEELEGRRAEIQRFFRTGDRDVALGIARGLGARALCLYGSEAPAFDLGGLVVLFRGDAVRVYALPDEGYLTKR